jgi:4-amino-4-deoxy-L-arabinose transferase-like glycosyltransferase
MLDAPLTAIFTWTLIHLWAGKRNHRHWYWLGLPIGLGVRIKSLAALPIVALILLTIVVWCAAGVPFTKQQWRALLVGAFIAIGIVLPWYLVELIKCGTLFLHDALSIHLQGISSVTGNNRGDWRFYLLVIARGSLFGSIYCHQR